MVKNCVHVPKRFWCNFMYFNKFNDINGMFTLKCIPVPVLGRDYVLRCIRYWNGVSALFGY